ncbi:histidinol dehydrogenase [Halococcus saccharolyticus]|uniref:Histidinol dehydrogenase n=1 Tax=Halococcus saccharolyticus DSM 5350 TaxID=1227455 RepID=M0MN22_9EURY|nr:histidinol dehydrogenase [Halococcus saccharolyticus]EMA46139.1 bifunctional histidinal dehydrogenase/ histidinol dehydrogenase [Halococcus saccharolyticus DSM 5350]
MNVNAVAELAPDERRALFDRDAGIAAIESDVTAIVDRVREEGDVALREYAEEFDDVTVGSLDITDEAERAYDEIDDNLRNPIETAAANIREFHERQVPDDWRESFDGRELGQRYRPIERIGAYVPGGSAAYPSSALMTVVPAKVAGVEQVAVTTPPADEINPATLAALHVAGADAIYQVGGAQAIAALAYGTETVPRVQKIVGPGNRWVTAAKAAVRNDCEIDFLAGPSEICVLADETAEPQFVAADLLAQAEHDPNASVVAVTDDETLAGRIVAEVEDRLAGREREDTIRGALENDASGVFHARSMSEAVLFCEEYAAEHLSIQAAEDEALLDRIASAGSAFLGPHSPVAAGDYAAGPNHVLPTGGHAKIAGGLSVDSFLRSTTVQRLDADALDAIGDTVTTLAAAEGLEAHAESVALRLRESENAARDPDRLRE